MPAVTVERRRFPRAIVNIPVRYQPDGSKRATSARIDVITTISQGGCFIRSKLTFPKDTRLSLVFPFAGKEVSLVASVKYAVPFSPKAAVAQFPGMGLQFEMIDEDALQIIREFVAKERLKQGLGVTSPGA